VRRFHLLGLGVALALAACGGPIRAAGETAGPAPGPTSITTARISLPLSLYVVRDSDSDTGSSLSSGRDERGLRTIAEGIQEIWNDSGIVFEPVVVHTIEVPRDMISDLAEGRSASFLRAAGDRFEVPDPGAVNGFYVSFLGGVNGFTPQGSRVFFVTDDPSVHDERVSSHEIGHILGLHHEPDDASRLMFSGTNGTLLTPSEVTVARYDAEGILDGTG